MITPSVKLALQVHIPPDGSTGTTNEVKLGQDLVLSQVPWRCLFEGTVS